MRGAFVENRWHVGAPRPVGPLAAFVDEIATPAETALLAGFDMPIGLPAAFGARTCLVDFATALPAFGRGTWASFYDVAEGADAIGLHRPFYPARPGRKGTVSQRQLAEGHGVASLSDLMRRCERASGAGRPASPLFWTLGAAAVGKAAIHGWQEVVAPAIARGAALWPFEGDLPALAASGRPVLAETYPADVYGRLGLSFSGRSKTRQSDRASFAAPLQAWMDRRDVVAAPDLDQAIVEGFGPTFGTDDGFDALVGLLGLVGVVTGERPAGAPLDPAIRQWEGWIIGRADAAGEINPARSRNGRRRPVPGR